MRSERSVRPIEELEEHFERLLLFELQKEAAGQSSPFLQQRLHKPLGAKLWHRQQESATERLLREVMSARRKLGKNLREGAVGIVLAYDRLGEQGNVLVHGSATNFAKQNLSRLQKYIDQKKAVAARVPWRRPQPPRSLPTPRGQFPHAPRPDSFRHGGRSRHA